MSEYVAVVDWGSCWEKGTGMVGKEMDDYPQHTLLIPIGEPPHHQLSE